MQLCRTFIFLLSLALTACGGGGGGGGDVNANSDAGQAFGLDARAIASSVQIPTGVGGGGGPGPYSDFARCAGVAVIGGYVYRGGALPALAGRYVYGDYTAQTLWALQFNGNGSVAANDTVSTAPLFMLGMDEDQNGELYVLSSNGAILGLEAAAGSGAATPMPTTLSATGLFSDLAQLTPSPGVIDYEVDAPF